MNAPWRANCLAVLVVLAMAGGSPSRAQENGSSAEDRLVEIDRNGVLMLVRSAIIALDHANKTGNYSVLRDLSAPIFQRNNPARLGEIFAAHREQELDLAAVMVIEPQLTTMPHLDEGRLRITGFFPSVPSQVHFDLLFAPVGRQWRLSGIWLDVSPSGPLAPESEPEDEPETSAILPDPPTPTVSPRTPQ